MTENKETGRPRQKTIDSNGNVIDKPYGLSRWARPRKYSCKHEGCELPTRKLCVEGKPHNCCMQHDHKTGDKMRFFTSDTHFGHKNIIKYSNRPFADYEEMDRAIVDNWNHIVGDTDVVYHLGDLALGPSERWDSIMKSLNGYKILVVGNHDRIFLGEKPRQREKWDEKYHEWFDEVYDNYEGLTLANGTVVNLSHFPYDGDSHGEERYREYRLEDNGTILIHGHTHEDKIMSKSNKGTVQIHVGMDAWNYTPVSEQQIMDSIRVAEDIL